MKALKDAVAAIEDRYRKVLAELEAVTVDVELLWLDADRPDSPLSVGGPCEHTDPWCADGCTNHDDAAVQASGISRLWTWHLAVLLTAVARAESCGAPLEVFERDGVELAPDVVAWLAKEEGVTSNAFLRHCVRMVQEHGGGEAI